MIDVCISAIGEFQAGLESEQHALLAWLFYLGVSTVP